MINHPDQGCYNITMHEFCHLKIPPPQNPPFQNVPKLTKLDQHNSNVINQSIFCEDCLYQSLSVYIRLLFGDVKVDCFSKIIIENQYKENDAIAAPLLYLITDCIDIFSMPKLQNSKNLAS